MVYTNGLRRTRKIFIYLMIFATTSVATSIFLADEFSWNWLHFVWQITVLQFIISLPYIARGLKCRHSFDYNRVIDLNDDPPCKGCGRRLGSVLRENNHMVILEFSTQKRK